MKKGIVRAVNISKEKGEVKTPVDEIKLIEDYGIEGDAHAGPGKRQVSLLAQESVDEMKQKTGIEGLTEGIFAENLTTEGLELYTLEIGTRLKVGETILEVTQIGKECHSGCAIMKQVGQCIMPKQGIFTRVVTGGIIRPGDTIEVLN
ncbi:MAG: MOSC domain-containing protein [Clostridiales bacterium]|nr:MOSC domain-containing protein [Clostridiales bacterium]